MIKKSSLPFGENWYGLRGPMVATWAWMYVDGLVEFLDFIFTDILPPRALLRSAITGFLLAKGAFWLFGDGVETPDTVFRVALALTGVLLFVELILNLLVAALVVHARSLVEWLQLRSRQRDCE